MRLRWLCWSLSLPNFTAVAGVLAVTFPSDIAQCPNPEDRQFVVAVPTKEPLGLRLGDKLEILEFIADAQGRSRVVEASGLAEVGDRLIAVNNVSLVGTAFQTALSQLAAAALPKQLRFQTYDGRCMVDSGRVNADAGSKATTNSTAASGEVVLSLGASVPDRAFYAVLSASGQPPSCLFRDVVVADPPDACSPLVVNASDRYVVVSDILGCPAHQKAALAQEAGAKGVLFAQRMGEKPQQIKLPKDLPKPIALPLVMVSFDSGWQIVQIVEGKALPTQAPHLRFVFSDECASDKFTIHPAADPFRVSVVNRIETSTAGFLSLTVAETGAKTLSMAEFEFLKPLPADKRATAPALPLGTAALFLRDASASVLNACEMRSDKQPPQLAFWASEIEDAFVAVRLRDSECSIATQVAFFASRKASGVVFGDASFPGTTSLESSRIAAQQAPIPFVFVSQASLTAMDQYSQDDQANHVLIEFAGENALQHQWADLGKLADPKNWPTTSRARERLFYRMLKDQDAVTPSDDDRKLTRHERRDALLESFERAREHFSGQGLLPSM